MYCWDLDATFDSNEDGVFDNDCDREGAQFDFIRSLSTHLVSHWLSLQMSGMMIWQGIINHLT